MHPVFTPNGRIVTDDYPDDHPHQHGIFFAWTKTEFEGRHPDFWNMGDGTGAVEFEKIEERPQRAGESRLQGASASCRSQRSTTEDSAERNVGCHGLSDGSRRMSRYAMFDIVSTQECASASPLILPDYRYGGIGIRGHRNWRTKANVSFLTSEGKDRIAGDDTTARWCAIGGRVDGQPVGIAALGPSGEFPRAAAVAHSSGRSLFQFFALQARPVGNHAGQALCFPLSLPRL